MSFGDEIKRIRTKELKITLDQLSEASGLSKGFLSKLENNKQDISRVDNIKKLAIGLNVPYIKLMKLAGYGGTDNPIPSDSFFDLLGKSPSETEKLKESGIATSKGNKIEIRKLYLDKLLTDDNIDVYYKDKLISKDDKESVNQLIDIHLKGR